MWRDSETEIDFLDYGYMISILKDIICNDELLPASIGIYGDWGSGKSSLIHMCMKDLEDKKEAKCLIFNGWLFESYSDAKTALLNSILDAIAEDESLPNKAKDVLKGLYKSVDKFQLAQKVLKQGATFAFSGGIGALAGITSDVVLSWLKHKVPKLASQIDFDDDTTTIRQAIDDELNEKSLRDDIRKFQEQFAELVKESKIKRLVIFIDELDRCREDTILDTLEAMKLFMFTGKVAFVIGADERHISYAVKSKFKDIEGIQIDIGKEYLEKLVQYPIHIPRMDIDETEVYIASLLLSAEVQKDTFVKFQQEIAESKKKNFLESPLKTVNSITFDTQEEDAKFKECLSISKQLASVLSSGLHGNPRQVKRFLNTMDMRMQMAKYKYAKLDRKILAKLMMLEYIRSAAFNLFAEMAANDELTKELEILESQPEEAEIDKLKLKSWTKDEWLSNWLGIEPLLAGTELNPYFYFARTSLDEKISRISVNLSPEAQNVLDSLMSKSDVKINKALKIDVSDAEANIIFEAMCTQMNKDTKIDKMHIKAFVDFSLANDSRYVTALEYIKSFSATSLQTSCVIYLADFAKKSELLQEMKELAEVWGKTNPDLETAFNNCLK
jgi:predicted KAP-like P-loop ATPase